MVKEYFTISDNPPHIGTMGDAIKDRLVWKLFHWIPGLHIKPYTEVAIELYKYDPETKKCYWRELNVN